MIMIVIISTENANSTARRARASPKNMGSFPASVAGSARDPAPVVTHAASASPAPPHNRQHSHRRGGCWASLLFANFCRPLSLKHYIKQYRAFIKYISHNNHSHNNNNNTFHSTGHFLLRISGCFANSNERSRAQTAISLAAVRYRGTAAAVCAAGGSPVQQRSCRTGHGTLTSDRGAGVLLQWARAMNYSAPVLWNPSSCIAFCLGASGDFVFQVHLAFSRLIV